jgi:SAM-dependent methyltransferase
MDGPAFAYQADMAEYVRISARVYDFVKERIDRHCGGFAGKTVLEYGAGFQLPQGGLPLALALKDGARQCYGVDIPLPTDYDAKPDRVAFWRAARDILGVDCAGLDQHDRVTFHLYDTLWFDDFLQPLTLLQMSASNMFFRDAMFDLAFSNAVMEHVKKPADVMRELFRVLKPGGYVYMQWNQFAGLTMGGHDVGVPFFYPWAHLRLGEKEHVEVLREVFSSPELSQTAFPEAHTPTLARAAEVAKDPGLLREQMLADLNKHRISHMIHDAEQAGFKVVDSEHHIDPAHRKYLTAEIRAELPDYSDAELLAFMHGLTLRKPPS